MKKLKVLGLIGMSLLPSSFSNLVNLRMLRLNRCKLLADVSLLKELKNLEILSLVDSDIKELAPEITQLTHLRLLDLRNCDDLRVIPPRVISSLTCLEELYIPLEFDGWEMEATNNEERTNASLVELNSLNGLLALEIHIPNITLLPKDIHFLKSIGLFKISMGEKFKLWEYSSSTNVLKLMNIPLKDEFIVLMEKAEGLYLKQLEGLRNVFDNRNRVGSFRSLRELYVYNCGLKYLFSPSTARGLVQLQKLYVDKCEMMEEIVGNVGEKNEDEVVFPRLEELWLRDLTKLRSFYPKVKKTARREGGASPSAVAQPLFNEKVVFPALEVLHIANLGEIREIWGGNLEVEKVESFPQLRHLRVRSCDQLLNVISSNMLPRLLNLVHLQTLKVQSCNEMEEIVTAAAALGKGGEDADIICYFPQLKRLTLKTLPKLKSFYCSNYKGGGGQKVDPQDAPEAQHLFNHKVVFPALEELDIAELGEIREIWGGNLEVEKEKSFKLLRLLDVLSCGQLLNVVSSNMLPRLSNLVHLQTLRVESCDEMEKTVTATAALGKGEEDADIICVFPQLKRLALGTLPKLKSFYSSSYKGGGGQEVDPQDAPEAQHLFNHKVAFPVLEALHLYDLGNTREICSDHIPGRSFCKLRNLTVWSCDNVLRVVSPNLLQRLQNLEVLRVEKCASLSEVFDLQGLDFGTGLLKFLSLVRTVEVINLPKLICLWNNEDAHRILSFENLERLKIQNCEFLRYLFHSSVAMGLVKLEILEIRSCRSLEEIVAKEGGEEVVNEIVSAQLKSMVLECPSLKKLRVVNCPKINTTALSELGSSKTEKSINNCVSD